MSLGFLAKDSIADLEVYAARAEAAASERSLKDDKGPISAAPGKSSALLVIANPQQAQEDDLTPHSGYVGGASSARRGGGQQRASGDSAYSYSSKPSSINSSNASFYYSGFSAYEGDDYYHDSYSSLFIGEKKSHRGGLLDCLFPCLRALSEPDHDLRWKADAGPSVTVGDESEIVETLSQEDSLRAPSGSREDDEVSTNSDVLGERLSEKERQAVLARLRLARPDAGEANVVASPRRMSQVEDMKVADSGSTSLTAKSSLSQKGLLNGIPAYDTSPLSAHGLSPPREIKGILKRNSFLGREKDGINIGPLLQNGASVDGGQSIQRRSLFPSYETAKPRKHNYNVTFAPMARVVTVKSKNDMTADEKASVWFQKPDYEDFRKTGRIITKAMLEGGSEIWLTSSLKATEKPQPFKPNGQGVASIAGRADNKENPPHKPLSAPGDKWWHKFGHSRRGLEHIVSFDEGRQRQANVRNAIHAVLEEQARQRRYGKEDPEKLRGVSIHNTNWARDLALAAGASDADAVRSSFAEDRKSREFFLLKMAARSDSATVNNSSRVPEFMQPALHSPKIASPHPVGAIRPQRLDSTAATQIRYHLDQPVASLGPPPSSANDETLVPPPHEEEESSEPIRDPNPEDKRRDSMAQRAKGYLSEGAGRVDMSAVLSGLGAVPQDSVTALVS
jgi:hypothetical protein